VLFSILNPSFWYGCAMAAHGLLLVWTLLPAGRGLVRRQLVLLAVTGVIWGGYGAFGITPSLEVRQAPPGMAVELLYLGGWFQLLQRLLRGPYEQSMPEIVRRWLGVLWAGVLAIAALSSWSWYADASSALWSSMLHGLVFVVALACLALTAQLNRDAPVENRAALSRLVAGAGLAVGGEWMASGVALLTGYESPALMILRALAAVTAAVLVIAATYVRPQWSLAVFVSPQARSYVPRFLAMAGMLALVVALLPLYRSWPGPLAQPLAVVLLAVCGVPFALLLFSPTISARARVFVSKHFLKFRYDYREEWLRLIATLASPDQRLPLPERSIKAVAQIVGSPAGLLWMRRQPDGPLVCTAGWNTKMWADTAVALDDPAIVFMTERQWILDTAELARNPAMYNGLQRPVWLERFPDALLLVPLISNEVLLGFMLLLQSSSAFRLTFEEIDLLRTSGRQVAAHLAQYEADQRLAEAKQFEAFNRLTAFLMHDLKNLIAQQSLVVKNAARHKGNPAFFEDAIATIENSVARMSRLLQQLQSGETSGRRTRVRLAAVLQDAVDRCRGRVPEPRLTQVDERLFSHLDRDRFAMVAAHLIRNAQEATGTEGNVQVTATREGESAVITIEDDGCGMDQEFLRHRLFRPFDSTKGSKGMGIGAYQARTFVMDSGGTMEVASEPGRGTCITIRLPLAEPAEATG